jgi:hypothetical protein
VVPLLLRSASQDRSPRQHASVNKPASGRIVRSADA